MQQELIVQITDFRHFLRSLQRQCITRPSIQNWCVVVQLLPRVFKPQFSLEYWSYEGINSDHNASSSNIYSPSISVQIMKPSCPRPYWLRRKLHGQRMTGNASKFSITSRPWSDIFLLDHPVRIFFWRGLKVQVKIPFLCRFRRKCYSQYFKFL